MPAVTAICAAKRTDARPPAHPRCLSVCLFDRQIPSDAAFSPPRPAATARRAPVARAARSGLLAPLGLYAEKLAPRGDGGSQRRGRRSEALSDRWPPTPTPNPTPGGRPRHSAGGWALSRGFVRRGLAGSPQSFSLRPWLQPFPGAQPRAGGQAARVVCRGAGAEGPAETGADPGSGGDGSARGADRAQPSAHRPLRTPLPPGPTTGPAHGEHARGPGQSPNPFHPNPQRLLGGGSMPALGFVSADPPPHSGSVSQRAAIVS